MVLITRVGAVLLMVMTWLLGSMSDAGVPAASLQSAPYAQWAHEHWVWLSRDRLNQSSITDYVNQYLEYGVKVGAVDLDSGWSTGFNNFEFDTKKFPNASGMIDYFHSKSVRVVLWATSMIDTDSSNYQEAHDNDYMIKDVLGQQAVLSWWHGKGGLLDYTNPKALQWWHSQLDKVLDLGIDGWKCDGTDPYILELVVPLGHSGVVTRSQYSHHYYGDFFNYTRSKLGMDRLIMSRPADGFGPLYLDFSPYYVMFSGWVGDDDPTFPGLESALKSYLQSAWAGYANFGSDIGGYRTGTGPLGRSKELFLRWAGVGAFSPLMENGGNKEHRPWAFDSNNQTLHIYNRFVTVHYEIGPYLLTTGTEAFETKRSSITPLAKHDSFINKIIDDFKPSTLNYLLGVKLLVAPVHNNDSSSFSVSLPSGHSWMYWWDHSKISQGGTTVQFNGVPLDEIPVFLVSNTFIPLRVMDRSLLWDSDGDYMHWSGPNVFTGYLRWLLHSPQPQQQGEVLYSPLREEDGGGMELKHWWVSDHHLVVTVSAHSTERSLLQLAGLATPLKSVTCGGEDDLPLVHSLVGLTRQQGYLQQCTNYCSVLIHPGHDGSNGHVVHLYF
ncbi:alpha-glucosidase 2-like [Halichondria panicea]|uniref:alpha-glucosidase 2-like n=1 Tax=Halichondria panicea TaxID=6063 RepID=UPI00312B710C